MQSLTSAEELLRAIDRGQLFLDYQATVEVDSMQPRGAEALIRWRHPSRGVLSPGQFLPLMASGLGSAMVKEAVTRFVLDVAITQCAEWRRVGLDIPVSVNVAPCSLTDSSVPDAIEELLFRERVPADRLTIEVTELEGQLDTTAAVVALDDIARLGVRLSLDDFGTGHASLQRLHARTFDEIKIDRTFVSGVCSHVVDRRIVEFTVELARHLDMEVVAEGVETAVVLRELGVLGPRLAQGYYLHRPSNPGEVADLFRGTDAIDLRAPRRATRRHAMEVVL
jgi:EAL domain-containing protein (putative c-di-GMP-specific phosphodiesterase class I)